MTRASWLSGRRGRTTAGGVRAAVDWRRGLRAEALLLHHNRRRRRHYVLDPVLSPASPLPLALHLLHAEKSEERRKNDVRCAYLVEGNDGIDFRSPKNPRDGEANHVTMTRCGRGWSEATRVAGVLSFQSHLLGKIS